MNAVLEVRINILGPWDVRVGQRAVEIPRGQLRTLLASLLLSTHEPVPVATLVERAWPEHTPERARATLHTYATRLRKLLGPELIETARGNGYRLVVPCGSVDLYEFRRLVDQARAVASPEEELRLLQAALRLWRGKPFGDETSTWLDREVVPRLTEEWFIATERRIDLELAQGRPGLLVAELRDLTERFPTRESLWARLITALHRAERRAEALQAYQTVRSILADELGIDPSEQLVQLQRAVLRDEPAAEPPVAAGPRQLPHDIAGVVGRDAELATLDRLVGSGGSTTIVAIDGAAGTGKTTLAVHWAHRIAHAYPEVQLHVNLRGYGPGEPVAPAVAIETMLRALGVGSDAIPAGLEERSALLRSTLAGRKVLILLDNARDAGQVRPLLPGTGGLVIVTSRNQLRGLSVRDGAHRVTLGSLAERPALELLAGAVGADRVAAEPDAARELTDLCDRLPLALAIVAERAHRSERLAEVVRSLADEAARLDALGTGGDDPDTDLRAALSWSYRALSPDAAAMLRKLGLHPAGDFALGTAAALADVPVATAKAALDHLVAAHLVGQRRPNRYELHDLIRLYAVDLAARHESPGDRDAAVRRLLDWYLHAANSADRRLNPNRRRDFLATHKPQLPPPEFADARQATAWFSDEFDSLRAAVDWAARNGWAGHAWRIAMAMTTFFDSQIPWRDGLEFYQSAVRAARVSGELAGQAYTLNSVGCIHLDRGAWPQAIDSFERSLDRFVRLGNDRGAAMVRCNLAMVYGEAGDPEAAKRYASQALEACGRFGYRRGVALNLDSLGVAYSVSGDQLRALASFRQALAVLEDLGDTEVAYTLHNMGKAYARLGEHRAAVRHYRLAVDGFHAAGNNRWTTLAMVGLAQTLDDAGHPQLARRLMRTAAERIHDVDDPRAREVMAAVAALTGR